MKLFTVRDAIRDVAKNWKRQYGKEKSAIYSALKDLDKETATADDVARIIGNGSWTRLTCRSCYSEVQAVILVSILNSDMESIELCLECVKKAAAEAERA